MPGDDPAEALRIVLGELPDLPHLPELPARGAGADLTGRTAALLVDMPVETTPTGWRFAASQGRDTRRARSFLARDLDTLEEIAAGYEGPFKIQVCGPLTLAATIELAASQNPALADPGAARDLAASLAEGIAAHVAEVAKRLPAARVLLQLDEPALPAVLDGAVPTASGLARLAPVEGPVAQETIRGVIEAAGPAAQPFCIVHCCARAAPLGLIGGTGARAVSFDLSLLRRGDSAAHDAVAEAAEAGLGLLAGVVGSRAGAPGSQEIDTERLRGSDAPASAGPGEAPPPAVSAIVTRVAGLWRRLGLPAEWCAERMVLTPACGLAGASPGYARTALARCRDAARAVREELER
jgi:hypothetical protein